MIKVGKNDKFFIRMNGDLGEKHINAAELRENRKFMTV